MSLQGQDEPVSAASSDTGPSFAGCPMSPSRTAEPKQSIWINRRRWAEPGTLAAKCRALFPLGRRETSPPGEGCDRGGDCLAPALTLLSLQCPCHGERGDY